MIQKKRVLQTTDTTLHPNPPQTYRKTKTQPYPKIKTPNQTQPQSNLRCRKGTKTNNCENAHPLRHPWLDIPHHRPPEPPGSLHAHRRHGRQQPRRLLRPLALRRQLGLHTLPGVHGGRGGTCKETRGCNPRLRTVTPSRLAAKLGLYTLPGVYRGGGGRGKTRKGAVETPV